MFKRKAVFVVESLAELPRRDSGVLNSIVRVHPSRIDAKRVDTKKLFRRQPVLLKNRNNGLSTVRFVLGRGDVPISTPKTIAVDYDTRDALNIEYKSSEVSIDVYRANYLEVLRYYYTHPDMGYQVATRLGLLGVALGIVGAVLGIISVF